MIVINATATGRMTGLAPYSLSKDFPVGAYRQYFPYPRLALDIGRQAIMAAGTAKLFSVTTIALKGLPSR